LQPGTEASNTGICFPAVSYYWWFGLCPGP
jgi:hypothetical protein